MKLERKVNKYRNVCLVCTDLGRNSELKLSVKSWYETFKDGNGSKALKELVFNKSEDTGILATYSNSTLDSLTTDTHLFFVVKFSAKDRSMKPMRVIQKRPKKSWLIARKLNKPCWNFIRVDILTSLFKSRTRSSRRAKLS